MLAINHLNNLNSLSLSVSYSVHALPTYLTLLVGIHADEVAKSGFDKSNTNTGDGAKKRILDTLHPQLTRLPFCGEAARLVSV